MLDTKGAYTTSVDVSGGRVAAFHVKHATKGDVPVTKYKTHMKVVQASVPSIVYASLTSAQDTYLGIEYIGYSYVDELGNEEIYWFPYDVILDGETGAIEYVPTT